MAESRTLPHNSFKVHLATDFVFQIQFFLGEFVFEFSDFTIRQRVLHTDRDLLRDLGQERRRLPIESVLFAARQGEHAKRAPPADERHVAERIDTLAGGLGVHLRSYLSWIELVQDPRLAALVSFTGN